MNRIFHLLRWHFRHYRWLIGGILLVTLVLASVPMLGLTTRATEPVFFLSLVPYLAGAALLCTLLIHSQPHTGSDSFWMTRAFTRREFLAAQYLVLFLVLALPCLIILCAHAIWMEGSVLSAIQIWLLLLGIMSVIFAAAVLTSNVFFAAGLLFAAYLIVGVSAVTLENSYQGFDFNEWTIFVSFPLCGLVALLITRFSRHRLRTSLLLFIIFPLLIPAISVSMPRFMKQNDTLPAKDSIRISFRDDPGESTDALSFSSNTLVETANKNILIVPTEARVKLKDTRYTIGYWQTEIEAAAPDAILRHFPADALIKSSNPTMEQYRISSGRGITMTNANGTYQTKVMSIDSPVEGEVSAQVYEVFPLEAIPLREGERSIREGHSIKVNTIDRNSINQVVTFTLKRFGKDPLISRRSEDIYSVVLFSPSAKSGVYGDVNEFYGRGTFSPVVDGRTDSLRLPLNRTFTEADDVEMHVFVIRKLDRTLKTSMTFQPGNYPIGQGGRGENDPHLTSIKDLDAFTEAWIAEALSAGSNRSNNALRKSLLARTDSELAILLEAMLEKKVPLGLFEQCFRGRKDASRLPVDRLIALAPEHPVLFDIVMRHKKSDKGVSAAAALLKSSDAIFPPSVSILAARSEDENLLPKLREQFLASKTELNKFHDALEPWMDEKELQEMVDTAWRKAEVEIISAYRIAATASEYGYRDALISLMTSMESQSPKQRANTDQFKEIKAQVYLTPEQKEWDGVKLAKWMSDMAGDFKYSPESKGWFAEP